MSTKVAKRKDIHGAGPVRYHVSEDSGKSYSLSIAVDYANAPVPRHYYVADYFFVEYLGPQVLFVFGKLDHPKQDQLRTKLEIFFPAMFFIKQLWQSSRDFHGSLRKFVEENDYTVVTPGKNTIVADKVQTVHSNNVLMVHTSGECLVDFFYLSPKDVALKPRKKQNIELEAQVRVLVPVTLLLGFLDACEPIVKLLAPKFVTEEKDDGNLESA